MQEQSVLVVRRVQTMKVLMLTLQGHMLTSTKQ